MLPPCKPQMNDNEPLLEENLLPPCKPQMNDNEPLLEENLLPPCKPHMNDNETLQEANLLPPCKPQWCNELHIWYTIKCRGTERIGGTICSMYLC